MPKLANDRHERFVLEYRANGRNATEAARAIGVPEKSAHAEGNRLLKRPDVAARLAGLDKTDADRLNVTTANVLRELAAIGYSNVADYLDETGRIRIVGVDRAKLAAVKSITVDTLGDGTVTRTKLELHDKIRGAELLGKHLNLFKSLTPFDLPDDTGDTDIPDLPARELARRIAFALTLGMRAGTTKAAPKAAAPTKH